MQQESVAPNGAQNKAGAGLPVCLFEEAQGNTYRNAI
jgi:hypothetical protein